MRQLQPGDALVVVDLQRDFLPGGQLAVGHGDAVVPVLKRLVTVFSSRRLPVVATRDWHPPRHCSFRAQGGPWPPHCVAGTPGATFAPGIDLPASVQVVSKGTVEYRDAYSGFDGTPLDAWMRSRGVRRLFVGGLATDYCVLNTVRDALRFGYAVVLLEDAIRAVDVAAGDGARAVEEMLAAGAEAARSDEVVA